MTRRNVAVVFPKAGHAELEEAPVPATGDDGILVRTSYSMVSKGTESVCLSGQFEVPSNWSRWVEYPFHPGYSCVGTVVESRGPSSERFALGDRVALKGPHSRFTMATFGWAWRVPDDVSDLGALTFALSAIAQEAIWRAGRVFQATIVVIGGGPLAVLVAQWAAIAGASNCIIVSRRRPALPGIEVTAVSHVASRADSSTSTVMELTGGRGADIVFDVTGDASVLAYAGDLAVAGGTVVAVGDPAFPSKRSVGQGFMSKGLNYLGVHDTRIPRSGAALEPHTYSSFVSMHFRASAAGRVGAELITLIARPEQATEVYSLLATRDIDPGGLAFDWRDSESAGQQSTVEDVESWRSSGSVQ